MELANKVPFDDRINHQADINDLSRSVILNYLNQVKSSLYDEAAHIHFLDLCQQMKIVRGTPEYLKPLNVGLLLFNENPRKYFTGAEIDIVIYEDESGGNFNEKKFEGPIQFQLINALSFLQNNLIREHVIKIPGRPESKRFYNFPYRAIEEILANAVYHRGYDNDNPIEVNVFPHEIEVLSFPGPLPPITKESLKQRRIVAGDYRNRRIGDFLKELKLTEGRSTGFPAIYDAMEKNGSPPPIFDTDDNLSYFLATIHSQKTSQKIMDLIKEKPDISTEEMGKILKVTRRAIAYQIEKLKKNGKIRRVGPDKGGYWEIL